MNERNCVGDKDWEYHNWEVYGDMVECNFCAVELDAFTEEDQEDILAWLNKKSRKRGDDANESHGTGDRDGNV